MRALRCKICKKYVKQLHEDGKCSQCHKEFTMILDESSRRIAQRYSEALKQLADK